MNVKEAVAKAKAYVLDLFENEDLTNVGLEEVEFNDDTKVWTVTIGFSRPWDIKTNALAGITTSRSYKVVTIDDFSGEVKSVKNRELQTWAATA